jgi:hypothetical protein
MVRRMWRSALDVSVVLLGVLLGVTVPVRAEPLPFDGTLSLGRPAHPVRVSLQAGDALTLVSAGKRKVLPAQHPSEVSIETVPVAGDGAVAILRVSARNGHWVGILGGRAGGELLSFERADSEGDPGERRTHEAWLAGEPKTLRTGLRFEGISLCSERPALFERKRIDEESLLLVAEPVGASAMAEAKLDAQVTMIADAPAPPVLHGLAAIASSELDPDTKLPRAPRTLVDDDPAQGLALRAEGFALLRWEGGALPIERLQLLVHARDARALELYWLGDQGFAVKAALPLRAGEQRLAIVPPAPGASRCLALLLPKAEGVELRELSAYTDLDREGGLDRLVGALVQDDARGASAVELLEKLGVVAAERVAARWNELSARGKRRGLKVLSRALARGVVRQRVLQTALGDDPELRSAALQVLERGGEPGRAGLRELAQRDTPAGNLAVRALGTHPEEVGSLLAALAREGGAARGSLRTALGALATKDPSHTRQAAMAWLAGEASPSARISLALALSGRDRELCATIAEAQLAAAQSFDDRYRLALALAGATPTANGDAWLVAQTEHADEWMQRRAAYEALVQRKASAAQAVGAKLAHDAYPRVRASTLAPLAAANQPELAEALLRDDPWPLVRSEAARALVPSAATRELSVSALEEALADRAPRVRRAAIESLMAARRTASWPRVQERLDRPEETLEVRMAALGMARELCLAAAAPSLGKSARKLLSPAASDDDMQLAVEALRVLHELGGEAAREGQAVVTKEGGPELAKLWGRLPAARCAVPGRS